MIPEFKRASWLELFYDVAFVALVAQLTYLAYEHHQSVSDFLNIFIIGYAIFIAWWATTANRNLKPTETTADKISIQIQMAAAFFMSITMPDIFAGNYISFFLTLALLRFVQSGMLARMYVMNPETRPETYNILEGFLAGGLLWAISAFVPAPYHFVIAVMALAVDVLTPLTRGKGNTTRYLNVYHLQERLGLFLMLVIGESMIVVALSNTAAGLSVVEPAIIFSGLGMMIALWWLYFEHSDRNQGVRPKNLFYFIHAHGFLFGSIILLSVGYKIAITQYESYAAGWFVVLGSLGVVMTLTIIRLMLYSNVKTIIVKSLVYLSAGTLVAIFGLLFNQITTMITVLTILFLLASFIDYKLAAQSAKTKL
jgi:low temperature requirement protein LtrA